MSTLPSWFSEPTALNGLSPPLYTKSLNVSGMKTLLDQSKLNNNKNIDIGNNTTDLAGPATSQGTVDPSHFQHPSPHAQGPLPLQSSQVQQQQHQSLLSPAYNGHSRNASPGFQIPSYQVNSVVPSKRPRPRDDSISISPRDMPGALPESQSQTPLAQNSTHPSTFPLYSNTPSSQRGYNPTIAFQQLSHAGSANETPSPTMQTQPFNPQLGGQPAPPKRVATQSPGLFSPASQHSFMPHVLPTADPAARASTPQSNAQPPHQSPGFPSTNTQRSFSPTTGMQASSPGATPGQGMQNNLQAQMMYAQMQMRHQQQRMLHQNASTASQMSPQATNGSDRLAFPQTSLPVSTSAPPNPNARLTARGPANPDQFVKSLQDFMVKRGTPIQTLYPQVGNRPIPLVALYASVMRFGGSRAVAAGSHWQAIANSLGLNVDVYSGVAEQLMQLYLTNLAPFEEAWSRANNDKKGIISKQVMTVQAVPYSPNGVTALPQSTSTTTQQSHSNPYQFDQSSSLGSKVNGSMISSPQNGLQLQGDLGKAQASSAQLFAGPVDVNASVFNSHSLNSKHALSAHNQTTLSQTDVTSTIAIKQQDSNFQPKVRGLDTHAGVDVGILSSLGAEVAQLRPTMPSMNELGVVDIHALTMSLKSGLRAEVRLALDTLVMVSVEANWSLSLKSCEDLVETLVGVAEIEVESLADNTAITSVHTCIPSYEYMVRSCRQETIGLVPVPRLGSADYELDRAADRLIAITTIFRNLSFFESNHGPLADPEVVTFISDVLGTFGRKRSLFRSETNTLDVMKDIVIFLSNLSQAVSLPSEHEALMLLEFLLAFAPEPSPYNKEDSGPMTFTTYQPAVHRYLPAAVDSLAKLLARDEPNRVFFKDILQNTLNQPYSGTLLTRAFALVISPIPASDNQRAMMPQAVEARKPYLEQGLLAAVILVDMIPRSYSGLARSWLLSEDGFSMSLLKFVCVLMPQQAPPQHQPHPRGHNPEDNQPPFSRLTYRGIMVLRKLALKAEMADNAEVSKQQPFDARFDGDLWHSTSIPSSILPKKENLLGALLTSKIDANMLRQLCLFANVNDGDIESGE